MLFIEIATGDVFELLVKVAEKPGTQSKQL